MPACTVGDCDIATMPESLNEKTPISLTISSWWQVVVILSVVVSCYFGLQAKTDEALRLGKENAAKQEEFAKDISTLQRNIQSITDNVLYFRETYERDKGRR